MLIAFDFDGVIADSLPEIFDIALSVARRFRTPRTLAIEDLRSARELTFSAVGLMLGIPEERVGEFAREIFCELERSTMPFAVYPGMGRLLEKLARCHSVVIITSNIEERVRKTLSEFAPGAAAVEVLDGRSPGRKAEKIRGAVQRHGAAVHETFIIGDSFSDITSGRDAGVRTIAVTWGFQPRAHLLEAQPEFVADTPEELEVILEDEG